MVQEVVPRKTRRNNDSILNFRPCHKSMFFIHKKEALRLRLKYRLVFVAYFSRFTSHHSKRPEKTGATNSPPPFNLTMYKVCMNLRFSANAKFKKTIFLGLKKCCSKQELLRIYREVSTNRIFNRTIKSMFVHVDFPKKKPCTLAQKEDRVDAMKLVDNCPGWLVKFP